MKNKTLAAILAAALLIAVMLTGHVLGAFDGGQPEERAVNVSGRPDKYTLKLYDGKIAVFLGDDLENPAAVTGILASELRAFDRQLLEQGIEAGSYEELLRLLEDFGP